MSGLRMFRSVFTRISTQSLFRNVNHRTYCTAEPEVNHRFREVNEISLVGTVRFNSINLSSGTKQLLIEANGQTYVVRFDTRLAFFAGQRIYVKGKLNAKPFSIAENRDVYRVTISAYAAYILDVFTNKDRVSLGLLATVSSDIINKDDHSIFTLVVHFTPSNGSKPVSHFHRVFVYDEEQRNFVREKLQKRDRVYITGTVQHQTHKIGDQMRQSGIIIANTIQKLAKRKNQSLEFE